MTKINPSILQRLRKSKGWSQEELSEKTKSGGQPKIDKQTISRLERGERPKTRSRTIKQLAHALGVDPAVLTGDGPTPDFSPESSALDSRSQLNVRIGNRPRNALNLVRRRYRVEPSQIVELAPFLFVWAAEESLRRRQERLSALDRALGETKALSHQFHHLSPEIINFWHVDDAIAAEQSSIEKRDLFGSSIDLDLKEVDPNFDADAENPFAMFLRELVSSFGKVATFVEWSGWLSPSYRVCFDEAAELVGGDSERADEILNGFVALNEMPKEIRGRGMEKERADWVRAKAEEYRQEVADDLAELNRLLGPDLLGNEGNEGAPK
jgi:transcriptional regulator with XRE-family HTH domain